MDAIVSLSIVITGDDEIGVVSSDGVKMVGLVPLPGTANDDRVVLASVIAGAGVSVTFVDNDELVLSSVTLGPVVSVSFMLNGEDETVEFCVEGIDMVVSAALWLPGPSERVVMSPATVVAVVSVAFIATADDTRVGLFADGVGIPVSSFVDVDAGNVASSEGVNVLVSMALLVAEDSDAVELSSLNMPKVASAVLVIAGEEDSVVISSVTNARISSVALVGLGDDDTVLYSVVFALVALVAI